MLLQSLGVSSRDMSLLCSSTHPLSRFVQSVESGAVSFVASILSEADGCLSTHTVMSVLL